MTRKGIGGAKDCNVLCQYFEKEGKYDHASVGSALEEGKNVVYQWISQGSHHIKTFDCEGAYIANALNEEGKNGDGMKNNNEEELKPVLFGAACNEVDKVDSFS